MLVVALMLAAMGCWIGAGLLGLAAADDRVPVALGVLGSLLGLAGALTVLLGGTAGGLTFQFWGVSAALEVDALSAAFLVPLHLVAALGLVYGKAYWPLEAAKGSGRWVRVFFGLLVASMNLVFIARQGVLFLVAWEAMAMAAMLLMCTEHEKPEVMRGAWVYLACTHVGTMLLTAMTILLAQRLGGYAWHASNPLPRPVLDGIILVLALLGFGFKAGLVPLHFWLPAAHAGSPSHVSAILSAVMLKAGVYGVLRVSGLLPPVPHLGGAVLAAGALTALCGVGCALAQRDFKRLLAYSSVENVGIIFMGVGLGWTGRAIGNPWIAALGFGAAILHMWNHAAFKSLLFFGAGSVLHATGTRDVERLGGLARRMPRTALALFPAVLAVAALPPFNGFVSEWLLYRGLFASFAGGGAWTEGLALTALALTGGLAGVAFAKFFGFIFLGTARSPEAEQAHDPGALMTGPMAGLAGLCLALSLGAPFLLPLLDRVLLVLAPGAGPALAPGVGRRVQGPGRDLASLLLALGAAALLWMRRAGPGGAPPRHLGLRLRPAHRADAGTAPARSPTAGASSCRACATRVRRIKALFPARRGLPFGVPGPGRRRASVAPRTELLAQRLHALPRPAAGPAAHVPALHPHHPGGRVPVAGHPAQVAGMILFGLCVLLVAVSGVPGLWSAHLGRPGRALASGPGGALAGLAAAGRVLIGGASVEPGPAPHAPGHPGLPAPGPHRRLVPGAGAGAAGVRRGVRPRLLGRPLRKRPAPAAAVRHHGGLHGPAGGRGPRPDLPDGLGGHGGDLVLPGDGRGPGCRHPARRLDLPGLHPLPGPSACSRAFALMAGEHLPLVCRWPPGFAASPRGTRHLPAPAGSASD